MHQLSMDIRSWKVKKTKNAIFRKIQKTLFSSTWRVYMQEYNCVVRKLCPGWRDTHIQAKIWIQPTQWFQDYGGSFSTKFRQIWFWMRYEGEDIDLIYTSGVFRHNIILYSKLYFLKKYNFVKDHYESMPLHFYSILYNCTIIIICNSIREFVQIILFCM